MDFKHVSVLYRESLDGLRIKPEGVYLDGTLGGAGHSAGIAEALTDKGMLYCIDRDEDAILNAFKVLKKYQDRVMLMRGNFFDAAAMLKEMSVDSVDGILLDLGVSSHQLDEPERGFSYMQDAPLDMRMDKRQTLTAHDIVNEYSTEKLTKIIFDYSEERWAKRIAEFIVAERKNKSIETTLELVEIVKKAIPKGAREDGPHPAKRLFQAIRIETNQELEMLSGALLSMAEILKPGGRFCVITFHSLEDRIVKNVFKTLENPCTCPPDFPMCMCGKKSSAQIITRKPILPKSGEVEENPRARSAKLRILEKLQEG